MWGAYDGILRSGNGNGLSKCHGQFPRRQWVPDDVMILDALPVGGTGKVQKAELREKYAGVLG